MTKYQYIKRNYGEVKKLVKNGIISPTMLNDFEVYEVYLSESSINSKMLRYKVVADKKRLCVTAVRNAINRITEPMR